MGVGPNVDRHSRAIGQLEATWAKHCAQAGGLLFSAAEVAAFNEIAAEAKQPAWNAAGFKTVTI